VSEHYGYSYREPGPVSHHRRVPEPAHCRHSATQPAHYYLERVGCHSGHLPVLPVAHFLGWSVYCVRRWTTNVHHRLIDWPAADEHR
jgi:hypothetical protein